jgi:hypothetical protein
MDDWELPPGHRDKADLAADVRARHRESAFRGVSIDGWSGSGKTRLAADLADSLGLTPYELDEYLHKERKGFLATAIADGSP